MGRLTKRRKQGDQLHQDGPGVSSDDENTSPNNSEPITQHPTGKKKPLKVQIIEKDATE
jgi:hypothetical protein